jgi:adenylate kinase
MNIIILGQQGSGKGTQAEKLAEKYDLDHFDTGRALRQVSRLDTALGKEVNEIVMVKKELVPSRILREVLHMRLSSLPREKGIVFDGVPRNMEQAAYFEEALLEFGRKIDKAFFVNIGENESLERISKRWTCKRCKAMLVMGKDIKKETDGCPGCGGEIMQREDDTAEGVRKRLKVFSQETRPVIGRYEEQGLLAEINGEQDVKKVFRDIVKNVGII